MKDYVFLFKVGRMNFLNLEVKGLDKNPLVSGVLGYSIY